jgi:hypothetical protein
VAAALLAVVVPAAIGVPLQVKHQEQTLPQNRN